MKCIATIEYSDGSSFEEREHEGHDLKETIANFSTFTKDYKFEKGDKITFEIIEE